jgi:hypothetical protein
MEQQAQQQSEGGVPNILHAVSTSVGNGGGSSFVAGSEGESFAAAEPSPPAAEPSQPKAPRGRRLSLVDASNGGCALS